MKTKTVSLIFLIYLLLAVCGCTNANTGINRAGTAKTPGAFDAAEVQASSDEDAREKAAHGTVLSSFTTKYNQRDKARANNIQLAARSINEKTVEPGEEFSYNNTVGPTTEKRGYMEAKIFVDGKEEKGYGGGVCQVSSTLYNTVEKSGLETTERHEHSKKVFYVKPNMDAATSYGKIDYKFKNTVDYPIVIKSYADNGSLTVDIVAA